MIEFAEVLHNKTPVMFFVICFVFSFYYMCIQRDKSPYVTV